MRFLLYGFLLLVALTGTARIGLFVLNRGVFGQKSGSPDRMKVFMIAVPPVLLLLTLLYIPLFRGFEQGSLSAAGRAGAAWLAASIAAGVYWIVDTGWRRRHPMLIEGVLPLPSRMIRLRKAHIPFKSLRNLGAHNDLYDLEITTHEILIPDLPEPFDGYLIAFITDPHVASFMRRGFYRECVDQINQRRVDVVLFGGDFVTWERHIPLMTELLTTGLGSRDGLYAVLGNHDYWADADAVVAALTARGVRFLMNRSMTLLRGGAAINLVGIDEVYRGRPDVEAAYRKVDESHPTLVISHHPDIIEQMGDRRADLLLCGHTHGGQIRLPYFGAVVVPSKHEGRYAAGFFRQRRTLMYVSRGLGAVPPLRILCPPELAFFVLRKGAPSVGTRSSASDIWRPESQEPSPRVGQRSVEEDRGE